MPPAPAARPTRGSGRANLGLLGGDDDIGRKRDLEAAAHGDAVDRGDDRLVEVVAIGEPAEALGWAVRPRAGLGPELGVILEIVAGTECLVAGARDDGDPQVGVGRELVERIRQLLVRHRVERVVDLGAIDGDDQQASVGLDLAVLGHGGFLPAVRCIGRRHKMSAGPRGARGRDPATVGAGQRARKRLGGPRAFSGAGRAAVSRFSNQLAPDHETLPVKKPEETVNACHDSFNATVIGLVKLAPLLPLTQQTAISTGSYSERSI